MTHLQREQFLSGPSLSSLPQNVQCVFARRFASFCLSSVRRMLANVASAVAWNVSIVLVAGSPVFLFLLDCMLAEIQIGNR